jgi:DNA-directed RNA polymerase subunit RPC12/RpoP
MFRDLSTEQPAAGQEPAEHASGPTADAPRILRTNQGPILQTHCVRCRRELEFAVELAAAAFALRLARVITCDHCGTRARHKPEAQADPTAGRKPYADD